MVVVDRRQTPRATKFESVSAPLLKAFRKAGFHLSPSHNLISPMRTTAALEARTRAKLVFVWGDHLLPQPQHRWFQIYLFLLQFIA